jgi:hypothetical protein
MLSDEDINRCSEQQARAYRQLTTSSERQQIDYSDKAHQGVYIRKFVRAHALMIAQVPHAVRSQTLRPQHSCSH